MIRFLLKGLIRDKHRSFLPFLVTSSGVMLTVVFHAWMTGVIGNSIEFNARFSHGHAKIMTRAYSDNATQRRMILQSWVRILFQQSYPHLCRRWNLQNVFIFGGIVDVPDKNGEQELRVLQWELESICSQAETLRLNDSI
jgi:putative ABC transport system permease protein